MKIPEEFLDDKDHELLRDCKELSVGCLTIYENWRESLKRNPRIKTTFFMNALFLNTHHIFSISDLVESGQLKSAKALLRVVIEVYININYVLLKKDNSFLVRFGYSTDKHYLDNMLKYKETFTPEKPNINDSDFRLMTEKFRESLSEWQKYGYDIKNMPDFRTRVEMIRKNSTDNYISDLYYNSYLFLSEYVHVTGSLLAEVSQSKDFVERWIGNPDHKSLTSILIISNEIMASMITMIEKNSSLSFSSPLLKRELVLKYSRYKKPRYVH